MFPIYSNSHRNYNIKYYEIQTINFFGLNNNFNYSYKLYLVEYNLVKLKQNKIKKYFIYDQ